MSRNDHCENCKNLPVSSEFNQTLDEIKFENSIFNSCVNGDLNRVVKLVNQKGKSIVNEQDKNGYSCLHYASRNSHFEICKVLIDNGANVNLKTKSCQSTPLHRASYIGDSKIVKLLLENRASSSEKDCDGKTPLHKCAEQLKSSSDKKYLETIKILYFQNPNLIHEKDNNDKSPLDICPDLPFLMER